VRPSARIARIEDKEDFVKLTQRYPSSEGWCLDWRAFAKDYDAIHVYNPWASRELRAWDAESTAWLRPDKSLKFVRLLPVKRIKDPKPAVDEDDDWYEPQDQYVLRVAARWLREKRAAMKFPDKWSDVVAEVRQLEKRYEKLKTWEGLDTSPDIHKWFTSHPEDRRLLLDEEAFNNWFWVAEPSTALYVWIFYGFSQKALVELDRKFGEVSDARRDIAEELKEGARIGLLSPFRVLVRRLRHYWTFAQKSLTDFFSRAMPEKFTYRGINILNPQRMGEPLGFRMLKGIDYLVEVLKKAGVEKVLTETLRSVALRLKYGPSGTYFRGRIDLYLGAAESATGKLLKVWIDEVVLHEMAHHIHRNLSPEAEEFWQSAWKPVEEAKARVEEKYTVTPSDRLRFWNLIERSGWNPQKAGRKLKGVDRLKYLAWLYKTETNRVISTPGQVRLTPYGRHVFRFFKSPREVAEESYGPDPRAIDRAVERLTRAYKSNLALTDYYQSQNYPTVSDELASKIKAEDKTVSRALETLEAPTWYAKTNPSEDFAETFVAYLANPGALSETAKYRMQRTLWLSGFHGKPVMRVARRYLAKKFEVNIGDPILYGKYLNKKGIVKEFKTGPKGDPIVVIEQIPNPTGRKQPKELKLFRVRYDPARAKEIKTASAQKSVESYRRWRGRVKEGGRNPAVVLYEIGAGKDPESKRDLESAVGMPILGVGSERIVFDCGRTVLKIAHGGSESREANRRETALWQRSEDEPALRAVLVPVRTADASGEWLVMDRAQPANRQGSIPPVSVRFYDLKPQNWGLHRGLLKLLDYSLWMPSRVAASYLGQGGT
jgi:hypothetical protein